MPVPSCPCKITFAAIRPTLFSSQGDEVFNEARPCDYKNTKSPYEKCSEDVEKSPKNGLRYSTTNKVTMMVNQI
jgi:hypothetical protein